MINSFIPHLNFEHIFKWLKSIVILTAYIREKKLF